MYTIEYSLVLGEKTYDFSKTGESITVLKRNMTSDILSFMKNKKLPTGECTVELTFLYDDEYYDSDYFDLNINKDYNVVELICA